ncbi:LysR family transcriptional regulator [Streptomyces sp. NPDC006356]
MKLEAFDLNTLIPLQALLEEANVTHAAARVGIGQPAMSGVLGRYRRHFGDELLVRTGREYELTPLARDLLPHVQTAVRRLRETFGVKDVFDPATSERQFTVACSDYALAVIVEPLRRLVRERGPAVRLSFVELSGDIMGDPAAGLRFDLFIAPLGYGFVGDHRLLFHDRLVCLVDRDNRFLDQGALDLEALESMPHAMTRFRATTVTPSDRILSQLGITPRVTLQAIGFLPLPFAVRGTDALAIVPERLARRFADDDRLVVVEPPFDKADMLEAVWWHPSRAEDAGHRWLLDLVEELAAELTGGDPVTISDEAQALAMVNAWYDESDLFA